MYNRHGCSEQHCAAGCLRKALQLIVQPITAPQHLCGHTCVSIRHRNHALNSPQQLLTGVAQGSHEVDHSHNQEEANKAQENVAQPVLNLHIHKATRSTQWSTGCGYCCVGRQQRREGSVSWLTSPGRLQSLSMATDWQRKAAS